MGNEERLVVRKQHAAAPSPATNLAAVESALERCVAALRAAGPDIKPFAHRANGGEIRVVAQPAILGPRVPGPAAGRMVFHVWIVGVLVVKLEQRRIDSVHAIFADIDVAVVFALQVPGDFVLARRLLDLRYDVAAAGAVEVVNDDRHFSVHLGFKIQLEGRRGRLFERDGHRLVLEVFPDRPFLDGGDFAQRHVRFPHQNL